MHAIDISEYTKALCLNAAKLRDRLYWSTLKAHNVSSKYFEWTLRILGTSACKCACAFIYSRIWTVAEEARGFLYRWKEWKDIGLYLFVGCELIKGIYLLCFAVHLRRLEYGILLCLLPWRQPLSSRSLRCWANVPSKPVPKPIIWRRMSSEGGCWRRYQQKA